MALIDLAKSPGVMRKAEYETTASSLAADQVLSMYEALRDTAPHRHERDKKYFVGHSGIPSTKGTSTRQEEHLAIALCDEAASLFVQNSDGLRLLDYQVPLKARQSDSRVGKVDIVALTDSGRVAVVELKVSKGTSKGENPLRALLESLTYCAIVEANAQDISSEIMERYGIQALAGRPDLVVIAPQKYWSNWNNVPLTAVHDLSDRLARTFAMRVRFLDLGDVAVSMGRDGTPPTLTGRLSTTVKHDTQHQ